MTHDHESDAHEIEDHDLGLAHDLPRLRRSALGRRGLLGLAGGLGLTALAGCAADDGSGRSSGRSSSGSETSGSGESPSASADSSGTGGTGVDPTAGEIPEETAGPFPGDGSNGPNVLTESGVVRRDLTSSFGAADGIAEGVPLTLSLRVFDLAGSDATPLAGAAIYAWHCDREGNYSLYSAATADQNYLRGVQETDAEGNLEFTTVFPGCYPGRWPHVHFEVYRSLADATSASGRLRTSQLALPQDVCETAYAAEGYEASVGNLAQLSLDTDMVFADGYSLQLAEVTGSVEEGYVARLNVPV